jgi:cellulose biosynthesis protein BcsQ
MRILFASTNWRMATDLASGYAEVDIVAIVSSYGQALATVEESLRVARVETIIIDARLDSLTDEVAGMNLVTFLAGLHQLDPELRIVVVSRNPGLLDEINQVGVELHIAHEVERAAANLARQLGLAPKSEVAIIFAITGLQGGAGRTFVARNLAGVLADRFERKKPGDPGGVLLWELDLKHPTLAFDAAFPSVTLDHGRRTIAAVLSGPPPRGDRAMERIMPGIIPGEETKFGYDVLLAPHGIREVESIYRTNPDLDDLRFRLDTILEALSRQYSAIVIDLGTDLIGDPGPRVAIARANVIAIVASPIPAGLSSVMAMRQIVSDLKISAKTRLVLNTGLRHDPAYIPFLREQAEGVIDLALQLPPDPSTNVWRELAVKLLELRK